MTTASPARLGPGYRLLGALLVSIVVVSLAYYLRTIGYLYSFSYGVSFAAVGTVVAQVRKKAGQRRNAGGMSLGPFEPFADNVRATRENLKELATRRFAWVQRFAFAAGFLMRLLWSLVVIQGLQMLLVRMFSSLVNVWLAVTLAAVMALVVLAWDVLLAWFGRGPEQAPSRSSEELGAEPVPAAPQAGE